MDELLEEYGMCVFLAIIGGLMIASLSDLLNQFTLL